MDKSQEASLKVLKKDMIDALESGLLKEEEQFNLIHNTAKSMIHDVRDDKITIACLNYLDAQEKLKECIKDKNDEIGKLQNQQKENIRKIYEYIKKQNNES